MTSLELSPLKYTKISTQRQTQIEAERRNQVALKLKALQRTPLEFSVPNITVQLRPIGKTKHSKQLVTNEVLQLSRTLRDTHLPNGLALKFQMTSRRITEEQNRKLQFALKKLQQHVYAHQHHLDQRAAEQKRTEQQAEAWRQRVMLTSL